LRHHGDRWRTELLEFDAAVHDLAVDDGQHRFDAFDAFVLDVK
jgi:hypothetical protein